ncbi:hypothetical protein OQA88_10630 [Cercophora sp. LCS_1]
MASSKNSASGTSNTNRRSGQTETLSPRTMRFLSRFSLIRIGNTINYVFDGPEERVGRNGRLTNGRKYAEYLHQAGGGCESGEKQGKIGVAYFVQDVDTYTATRTTYLGRGLWHVGDPDSGVEYPDRLDGRHGKLVW